jgi:hypothetical protein
VVVLLLVVGLTVGFGVAGAAVVVGRPRAGERADTVVGTTVPPP